MKREFPLGPPFFSFGIRTRQEDMAVGAMEAKKQAMTHTHIKTKHVRMAPFVWNTVSCQDIRAPKNWTYGHEGEKFLYMTVYLFIEISMHWAWVGLQRG